ncbi:GIY-YIG nuclease family protein [Mariniluteicoccus flavus]
MPWTYMLTCADGSTYVGSTRNLDARLMEHHNGLAGAYTRDRRPVQLIWAQEFERIDEAWDAERRLHGWNRGKRLALAEGRLNDLGGYSARSRKRMRG